jgi:large subunit ribosomal protein L17
MRHRNAGLKLGKTSSHRDAMFRNMVTSLLKHDRIRTTDVKAKELKRWADKIITLAKQGDLHSRRQALAIVREKDVVHKLFAEAAERFGTISGGYTRIVKAGNRAGDAAPVSVVELVAPEKSKKQEDKKKKSKVSAKKKGTALKKGKGVKKEKKAELAPDEKSADAGTEKASES